MLPHLYLIRHGETEWSRAGRHTSNTDVPLTAQGEDDARNLGQRFKDIAFDHVLSSPALRARQTCELAALGPVAAVESDLAEWNYGNYEGLRTQDIQLQRPTWNLFHDGCPAGENPAQISDRADRLITRLRHLQGNIALFSHGHFGRVIGAQWIGLAVEDAQHFLLNTASYGILGYEHDQPDQPVIMLWNAPPRYFVDGAPCIANGSNRRMASKAIERWENEGGEIPSVARNNT